jgi:hypothetical protein
VVATLMDDDSLTHIPTRHNNSGKVKIVSLSDAKMSGPGRETNTISDNCSPINIHIPKNKIKNYDRNMIINRG